MRMNEFGIGFILIGLMGFFWLIKRLTKTQLLQTIYGPQLRQINRKEYWFQLLGIWSGLLFLSSLFKLNFILSVALITIVSFSIPIIFYFQSQALAHAAFFSQITTFLQHFLAHYKLHRQSYHALIDVKHIMGQEYINHIDEAIAKLDVDASYHPLSFVYNVCPHFIVLNIMSWIQHVEEHGMDQSHEILDMLENDIDDWIEDSTLYIKKIHETKNKILILVGLALIIALFNQHMLSSFMDLSNNEVYQVTIFGFLCILLVTVIKAFQTLNTSWVLKGEYLCQD